MKGFLSLLGITLIVGAFGLILLSFSDNPLEELKKQERMYAYMETRQNHTADPALSPSAKTASGEHPEMLKLDFSLNNGNSCENPAFTQKKAGSD
ncbi:MAG TPA: hypothetical protein VLQ20_13305 [Planococcus sp. (in: firmicutes)]|nr:hypothetical protein [Planococcus sp. (in: firmicutes)]